MRLSVISNIMFSIKELSLHDQKIQNLVLYLNVNVEEGYSVHNFQTKNTYITFR